MTIGRGAEFSTTPRPPDDLGLDVELATAWFVRSHETPYVFVRVSDELAARWATNLGAITRRCYVIDEVILRRATETGASPAEIIAATLPDPGSTMSGDFGEILAYLYQTVAAQPSWVAGPKKWRLKEDRTRPAPLSDLVQFELPSWPVASEADRLLCAEVKSKATSGGSRPISEAIAGCAKDRASRLARTLTWLRERALIQPLGDVQLAHIDRFLKPDAHPPFQKAFRAIAVICESLAARELVEAPTIEPSDHAVIVIAVPDLRTRYMEVFEAARTAFPPETSAAEAVR